MIKSLLTFILSVAPSQVVKINDEQMVVDTVDLVAGIFDVKARGHAGTIAAAHLLGDAVTIIAKAEEE